jgi:predicted amidohydrolase
MCLAFGFAERVDTEVYNCAIFIDHRGRICGTHRKTQFAEGQHKSWYFNRAGKRIRTFETPWGRAGFLICNERWNPAIARTLVLDGARFLLVVSYGNRRKAQNDTVMAHARENGVPIVQASVGFNMIVSKGERVSYKWGCDQVTVSTVEIPENPSKRLARMGEREALTKLRPRMAECLKGIIKRHGRACLSPPQPKR